MTCGKIGATRNFALEFDIKDSNFFNSLRGEEGKEYWKSREGCPSAFSEFIFRCLYSFYVSSFPTGYPPTVDSSIFLLPYLPPPLFILPLSFSRPLTSLRSFLLCEYFPSLLLSFLPRKENPRRCFSLSLGFDQNVVSFSARDIRNIAPSLPPSPKRKSPTPLLSAN